MNSLEDIRFLYKPVQPTVRASDKSVSYRQILPAPKLQNFIYCYWQLKTENQLDAPFNYRVVADGCIDVFFELTRPNESFVMGFCKKYTEFPLASSFNYVGIRFFPTMFPQLFKIDAQTLSNRFENLDLVVPDLSAFIETQLDERLNLEKIKSKLDDYFLNLLPKVAFNNDSRLYDAIEIILKNFGVLNLQKDLNTGISHRQLRRLFQFYIGDSPKTFSKVVQFQNILIAKPSSQSLKYHKLFYDHGHFDQAHFIKDFKNFYGVTPSKAFR